MAFQVTKKQVLEDFITISIPYARAQYLLRYQRRLAYTYSRVDGWRSDIYVFGRVAISTGYGCFGKYDGATALEYYESAAKEFIFSNLDEDEKKRCVNYLLEDFIKLMTGIKVICW